MTLIASGIASLLLVVLIGGIIGWLLDRSLPK